MRLLLITLTVPLLAQDTLTVRDAARLALEKNQAIAAAEANVNAAGKRVVEARSGILPRVSYTESLTRCNNPVYVFGSLLTQHQFGLENFDIGPLNRPHPLDDFQSQVTLDQPLYDAGHTRNAMRLARLGQQTSAEEQRRVQMEVLANAARAYYDMMLAAENLKAAEQAVRSAEADVQQAQAVHEAGMSTDVDVLSIRVHLAAVNEQRIRRATDLDVTRAALNDAIGLPLDTPHTLSTVLQPSSAPPPALVDVEKAAAGRPEARAAHLGSALAETQLSDARMSLRPTVGFHAAFEGDRQTFGTRGGANWLAGVSLHWNVFNGFADKSRISESSYILERAKANEKRTISEIGLQVRRALADLQSARQRIEVAQAAVALAEESLRITKNRYEAGLSNVTELLRNEMASLESHTRYLAAVHDARVAAVMLELATGRLSPDSEVLN